MASAVRKGQRKGKADFSLGLLLLGGSGLAWAYPNPARAFNHTMWLPPALHVRKALAQTTPHDGAAVATRGRRGDDLLPRQILSLLWLCNSGWVHGRSSRFAGYRPIPNPKTKTKEERCPP